MSEKTVGWLPNCILCLFVLAVVGSVVAKIPVWVALGFGWFLFASYALHRGFSARKILEMSFASWRSAAKLVVVFTTIGFVTATWRACGTIPMAIDLARHVITPSTCLAGTFVLCLLMAMLLGTCIGTSATIGLVCFNIDIAFGIDPVLAGGAVLSGSLMGNRCSPVSSSVNLVAELTKTDVFSNAHRGIVNAVVPFVVTTAVFLVLGAMEASGSDAAARLPPFEQAFAFGWWQAVPVVIVLGFCFLKWNLALGMLLSTASATAIILCFSPEPPGVWEFARLLWGGYKPEPPFGMLSGGGVISLANAVTIVVIAFMYGKLLSATHILDGIKSVVSALRRRVGTFCATTLSAGLLGAIVCNQSLTIVLTHEICSDLFPDPRSRADAYIDCAVILPPLMPWTAVGSAVMAACGAPPTSGLAAVFLIALPLWGCLRDWGLVPRWLTGHHPHSDGN